MRWFRFIVLYTALALGANAALADMAAIEPLRSGSMTKLNLHRAPVALPAAILPDLTDTPRGLDEFKGKVVLVNFWATWCAPCRKEMPGLGNLQTELGGDDFQVVTIAVGRNPVPSIQKFMGEIDVDNLTMLRDPKQQFAREMAVMGLPITIILDREGQEIARLHGDAEWDSDSAKAIITALIGANG